MKLLSIRMFFLAFLLILTGSGFTKKAKAPKVVKPATVYYYFFEQPGDWLYDFNTTAAETNQQWAMYGAWVDEEAGGGTLVARGYTFSTIPHQGPPSVSLYAHF